MGVELAVSLLVSAIAWTVMFGTANEGYIFPLKERTMMNRIKQYQNVCS